MSKGKKLKKLAKGGLVEYQEPVVSGVFQGASALSSLGPAGMAAGAIGGGLIGLVGAKKQQALQNEQDAQSQLATNRLLMQNAGNSFKNGGKILASKLGVEQGGTLEPVSEDAVQVKANNPNQTDSVELDQAFVDHNEVIDRKKRVFSDNIYDDDFTMAIKAKRLEKMKSPGKRFEDANNHIESKLDALFVRQEQKKMAVDPSRLKARRPGQDIMDYIETDHILKNERGEQLQETLNGMKKKKLDGGGFIGNTSGLGTTGFMGIKKPTFKTIKPVTAPGNPGAESDPFNASSLATGLATFGPNLLSSVMQKKLKGPAAPQLETGIKLNRFSVDPQLQEANRQFSTAQRVIQRGTAQGSDLIAGTGSLLAKKLSAQNQIYGQINQVNSDVANKEAILNQGSRVRNAERITNFRNDTNDFANKKIQLSTENAANLGQKVLMKGKEHNEIDRDLFALGVLGKGYEDSGVLRRDTGKTIEDYRKKKGFKLGGKMSRKLKGIKC